MWVWIFACGRSVKYAVLLSNFNLSVNFYLKVFYVNKIYFSPFQKYWNSALFLLWWRLSCTQIHGFLFKFISSNKSTIAIPNSFSLSKSCHHINHDSLNWNFVTVSMLLERCWYLHYDSLYEHPHCCSKQVAATACHCRHVPRHVLP